MYGCELRVASEASESPRLMVDDSFLVFQSHQVSKRKDNGYLHHGEKLSSSNATI
jgi:hypothetical protein